MRLKDKIAIITGAGSGMGRATAKLFAAEGASVVLIDLDDAAVTSVREEIALAGGNATGLVADVSDVGDVQNFVDRTCQTYGTPHVLFNNAGIDPEHKKRLLDVDEAVWDKVMAVNLKAPFLATKQVAPLMIESGGGGSIINTASIGAFIAASTAGYCASKGGLMAFTRVAAVELGQYGIRVNALCPGATWTGLAEGQSEELRARGVEIPDQSTLAQKYSVLGRIGRPEDMAQMALFLASDESAYTTGAAFFNDGGMSIMAGVETHA